MSNQTVVPFRRTRRTVATTAISGIADRQVWQVAHLPDARRCGQWLDRLVADSACESTARSLWHHYPALRASTEKLATYITPFWPATAGGPLLPVAVQSAVARAQEAIDQGQAFEGRIVGVYLYGLLGAAGDIARRSVWVEDRHGQVQRWEYFAQPLRSWARGHGAQALTIEKVPAPEETVLSGVRTHMLARLTDPRSAGYLARHAAQG